MGATSTAMVLAAERQYTWTAISGVAAAILGFSALGAWRKKWEVDDTPTSTCRGVFVGRNEVVGQAVPVGQAITTPFSGTQAVWFQWHLERYRSDDDGGSWVTVEKRATAAPFWIQDDTGRILVRPRGAELESEQTLCNGLGRNFAPPYSRWQLRQWVLVGEDVQERQRSLADASFLEQPVASSWFKQGTAEPIWELKGRCRITEHVLRAGQPIYLLGDATPRTDATGLEFSGSAEGDLMITTKSEEEVASSTGSTAQVSGFLALAISFAFGLLLSHAVTGSIHLAWPIGLVAAELLVLFLITLVRNYNRQVTVKEQAAKAWSMIDVSLRRRADLLPNLAAVAEAYASHEQDVQATVAGLRADHALPATEVLPQDATLVAAEASDRGQRGAAAQAVALAEAYPDLKANTVFVDLMRRITDAEESVASARTFYNDAINVLRDRRQQFPGNLFARMVEVPSWRLFEADEADRRLPDASVAPAAADHPDDPDGPPRPPSSVATPARRCSRRRSPRPSRPRATCPRPRPPPARPSEPPRPTPDAPLLLQLVGPRRRPRRSGPTSSGVGPAPVASGDGHRRREVRLVHHLPPQRRGGVDAGVDRAAARRPGGLHHRRRVGQGQAPGPHLGGVAPAVGRPGQGG
ncbi:LemA family protein [Aquihabitans sp. G128]|nr:LemA family protein [Aquihabitans sp. G128]